MVDATKRGTQPDLSGALWQKSSHSTANGDCVEVAVLGGAVGAAIAVRDSKNPTGPALLFGAAHWHAFLDGVRAGDFD